MAINFEIPAPVQANRILIGPAGMNVGRSLAYYQHSEVNRIKTPTPDHCRFEEAARSPGGCQLTGPPLANFIWWPGFTEPK